MIKIIIPLASNLFLDDSSRNNYPLPLIEINGKTLIEYVLDNLNTISDDKEFIFILNESDCTKFNLDSTIKLLLKQAEIIKLKKPTKGAICSILMSIDLLNPNDEIIIVNSDQIVECNFDKVLNYFRNLKVDAGVITFQSVHPRWSYVKLIDDLVVQTAEKNPISDNAIAGFYYFNKANEFINAAFNVIKVDENYEGNYYTSSIYNQLILNGKKILPFKIDKHLYHSFYSIQKLKEFESYIRNKTY